MTEICIPLNAVPECRRADVEVRIPDSGKILHYRLECFQFTAGKKPEQLRDRADQIKQFIGSYSSEWELLQIMDAPKDAGYVQFLYREISDK